MRVFFKLESLLSRLKVCESKLFNTTLWFLIAKLKELFETTHTLMKVLDLVVPRHAHLNLYVSVQESSGNLNIINMAAN